MTSQGPSNPFVVSGNRFQRPAPKAKSFNRPTRVRPESLGNCCGLVLDRKRESRDRSWLLRERSRVLRDRSLEWMPTMLARIQV